MTVETETVENKDETVENKEKMDETAHRPTAGNGKWKQVFYCTWMLFYVVMEAILFFHIACADLSYSASVLITYSAMVLCFLTSALMLAKHRDTESVFRFIAFVFTLGADFFLVILGGYYEIAVTIFIGAQVFHFLRIWTVNRKIFLPSLIHRLALIAGAVVACIVLKMDYLIYVGAIYGVNLIFNLIDGICVTVKTPLYWPLIPGFFLFILCDICVAANGVGGLLGIPYSLQVLLSSLIWIFYLPSQVLIMLAGCSKRAAKGSME